MNYLDKTGLTRLWSKITTKLGQKQDTLISGTNIKTINNESLLGKGNINIANIRLKEIIPNNAGAHNSIYRGEDITDLFYDGTLSQQIAAGTFDDIFIGDYIIGQNSGKKYLVADINYYLDCGDSDNTRNITPHILMIPEKTIGNAKMNDDASVTGAYKGSKMYNTYLTPFKTTIINDFGSGHILTYRNYLSSSVTNGYESNGEWSNSDIEIMSEIMVYGSNIFHNAKNGTNDVSNYTLDKSQLSLFRLDKNKIIALNDNNERTSWWLRDVASSTTFCLVGLGGNVFHYRASYASCAVRPAFLVY